MQSVNQNPQYRANRKYYGHDLSQHLEFTSSVGHMLPVYYDIINPGEKLNIQTYLKTRTQPLGANTFTGIDEYIEWFFVPIHQIYKPFGNWYYGIQDFDSSLFKYDTPGDRYSPRMSLRLPYLTSYDIWEMSTEFRSESFRTLKGEPWYVSFVRLAAHFGINDNMLLDNVDTIDGPTWSITPILFAAYQKIWMDHFRDSNRIENDPRCYSLDQFYEAENQSMYEFLGDFQYFRNLFTMRYRPYKKDFYTNVFPSPVFGSGSLGSQQFVEEQAYGGTLERVNQWLTNLKRVYSIDPSGDDQNGTPTASALGYGDAEALKSELNRANIETLFATDKLLEITRRSGKHYDAQTLAHFGAEVPDTIEGKAHFLGRHTQEIIIGDVVSTADTSNGDLGVPLGEIGGKGYSAQNSRPIKFTAPCHGILMGIYSAAPRQEYYDEALDKLNCLINKEDWYVPEYDNLGMQPLFGYQAYLTNNLNDNNRILGWQYRYMEFKQKVNKIITGLKYTQKHWTAGILSSLASGTKAEQYYVSPGALDNAMLYGYNFGFKTGEQENIPVDTASELYQSDPLIHDLKVEVKKASTMSTYGLMEL